MLLIINRLAAISKAAFSLCILVSTATAQQVELRNSTLNFLPSTQLDSPAENLETPRNIAFEELISKVETGEITSSAIEVEIKANPKLLEEHLTEIRSALLKEVGRRVRTNQSNSSETVDRISRILGSHDTSYKRAVRFLYIVKQSNQLYRSGDYHGLVSLREKLLPGDERNYVSTKLTSLAHINAKQLIDSNHPIAALGTLSLLDASLWQAETFELTRESIRKARLIEINSSEALDHAQFNAEGVDALLGHIRNSYLSDKERLVFASELADVYGLLAVVAASKGQAVDLERYLGAVLAYRPSPHALNRKLALEIATSAEGAAKALSRNLVDQLRLSGALNIRDELRLVFSGFYGLLLPASFFFAFLILLLGLSFIVLRYIQIRRHACGVAAGLTGRFQTVKRRGYKMACSIEDEQSLLRRKINSSDDDASLEQFRKCYEEERKRLEDSNTSPEELAELDRAYTRLCDMESGGFRPIELSD